MKFEYKTPSILIEDLEKVDVLLDSADTDISDTKRLERENRYGSFASFIIEEVSDWFN